MLFHQVQGAVCILKSGGVYKQVDVFLYGKRLFAKWGSGFIGLRHALNGTTNPKVSWEHIEGVDYHVGSGDDFGAILKGKASVRSAA